MQAYATYKPYYNIQESKGNKKGIQNWNETWNKMKYILFSKIYIFLSNSWIQNIRNLWTT